MKYFSIYVHIPFCISKCKYCDFNSYDNKDEIIDRYICNLIKEIEAFNLGNEYICKTIYIGGGTPSYIDSKYIKEILNNIYYKFNIDENAEITIEVNPSSVTKEKLQDYYNSKINRVSMGLQSSNDELLKIIGRRHSFNEFLEKYNLIKEVGFKNINVDLMLGLPNQNIDDVVDSVNKVISLKPNHISCYSLILYKNTKLFDEIENNKYILPNEDIERDMYNEMCRLLEEAGYIHYEISNFAKNENIVSKHNMMCWKQEEYIGFGCGAHSFLNSERFCNISDINKYITNIENNNINKNIELLEKMNKEELMKEYMILGFRLINGINKIEFKEKFNEEVDKIFGKQLNKIINEGYIKTDEQNYILTQKGIDFNNILCEEFV